MANAKSMWIFIGILCLSIRPRTLSSSSNAANSVDEFFRKPYCCGQNKSFAIKYSLNCSWRTDSNILEITGNTEIGL